MIVRAPISLPRLPASPLREARRPALERPLVWGIPLGLASLVTLAALHTLTTLRPSWNSTLEAYGRGAPLERTTDPLPAAAAADPRLALFTPEVRRWSGRIEHWAAEYDLQPELVATVMQIESCGAPGVRSPAGAAGLFQVMPFHFHENEDPLDVETNAARGLAYLARGLALADGRVDLALAGYNGGHGLIGRDPTTWPDQTQRYVHWGIGILNDVALGSPSSPTLQAWLAAGGAQLCRRASASGLAAR